MENRILYLIFTSQHIIEVMGKRKNQFNLTISGFSTPFRKLRILRRKRFTVEILGKRIR